MEIDDRLKIEYSRVLPDLVPYAFLYEAYKPDLWFWECVECARRLCLTGLLVFMYPGTDKQVVLAMILCMIFMIVYSFVQPFLDPIHNYVIGSAKWGIFLQLYGTLMLKQEILSGSEYSLGSLMVAVGILFPLLPMVAWRDWLSHVLKFLRLETKSGTMLVESMNKYLPGTRQSFENPMMKDKDPML